MSSKASLVTKTFGQTKILDSSLTKGGSTTAITLNRTPAAVTIASGTAVLTVAQVKAGVLVQTPAANSTMTLPTATALVGGFPGAQIGDTFSFSFINLAGATYSSTIAADAGSSLVGTAVIAPVTSMSFKVRFTAVTGTPTYVIYAI